MDKIDRIYKDINTIDLDIWDKYKNENQHKFENKRIIDYNKIVLIINKDPTICYRKLTNLYNENIEQLKNRCSESFIYKLLKQMNYSKTIRKSFNSFRESLSFFHFKAIYNHKLIEILKNNLEIIYIDESHFTTVNKKNYIWNCKDNKIQNEVMYQNDRYTTSLVLAASYKRIYHYTFVDRNNQYTFLEFLKQLSQIIKEDDTVKIRKYFLFMDNAKLHKTKLIRDYLKDQKGNVIYAVKYYPEYDMCELLFSNLKNNHYKRLYNSQ